MTAARELPQVRRAESLADQAYQSLREGIATGLFEPGERVTERGLAARLNVSPTPIREALQRLEQDGLIERVSARQLRVVEHSPETLRELLLAAAALRALEARFATQKITEEALDTMAELVGALDPAHGRTNADYLRIARAFDEEIEKAADNSMLRGLIDNLSILGQDRRRRAVQSMRKHRDLAQRRIQGHLDILAALRRRDPDEVEQAFRRHAVMGVELLLSEL